MFRRLIFFIAALCLFSACEKEEDALVLPPPTGASHASLDMGADYSRQIFFDFETGKQVFTSSPLSWDLAFEASPGGRHVFMNGGKNIYVYNTHQDGDIRAITDLPAGVSTSGYGWQYDASCGLPDSTGIGDWYKYAGDTKEEIYIVRTEPGVYKKMRILGANGTCFTMEWAPLESTAAPTTLQLTKDSSYNYVYFSFSSGVVNPEPPKATWDVVFTRYRPLVYDQSTQVSVPYIATGVLLNPHNTLAAEDSTTPFELITLPSALTLTPTNCRDVIGYDWKGFDFGNANAQYKVNRAKNYILHTRKQQIYKLHFLDFYNSSGVKGNPLFEYQQLR